MRHNIIPRNPSNFVTFPIKQPIFNGLVEGKILTGNPWVFTIKNYRLSGFNFPIIQFYDYIIKQISEAISFISNIFL